MEKICGIYKFTNKLNGKVYIGQSEDIYARYHSHIKAAKAGDKTLLYKAIRKYGKEGFDFDILIECPVENLNYWEIFYIRYYNSNGCKGGNGYNMTDGGDGITSSSWTPEMREHQRVLYKDKPRPGNSEDWKWPEESKNNQSIRVTNYFSIQENRDKAKERAKQQYIDNPELVEKCRIGATLAWQDEDYRNKRKETMKREYYDNPEWHGNSDTLKKQFKENPELKDRCKTCTGRKKINNGEIEKTVEVEELPYYFELGFKRGRLYRASKETREKQRKNRLGKKPANTGKHRLWNEELSKYQYI